MEEQKGHWTGFKCPECGSVYFGTDGHRHTGYCKGHYREVMGYSGCDFTWSRNDDEKYFSGFIKDDEPEETSPKEEPKSAEENDGKRRFDCYAEIIDIDIENNQLTVKPLIPVRGLTIGDGCNMSLYKNYILGGEK